AAELRAIAQAGGLGDPTEELAAYFEDPDRFLRTRTPTVVTALVTAARCAVAEAKLPRAMALADRACALAPGQPGWRSLTETVTGAGRTSRRNRGLAIAALAIAVVGGAVLAWRFTSAPATSQLDAATPTQLLPVASQLDASMASASSGAVRTEVG